MPKNNLQKQLKLECSKCETLYQLIETHINISSDCPEKCQKRWQNLCHEYYQEKVLGYLQQQAFAEEEESEELGIKVKKR